MADKSQYPDSRDKINIKPHAAFNAASARSKRPCPLWVDAFQRDTQHLGADEVGVYMLLLMAMWTRESCDLPDDATRLAKVGRISKRLWDSRIGPVIMPFFRVENGQVRSKRLRLEASYVERFCQLQSERKSGAHTKSDPLAKPTGDNEHSLESGENSRNPLENIDHRLSTDNTTDIPGNYPTQQPNNLHKKEDAAASAGATFREQILSAIGVDPVSGLTGHGGSQLGTQAHMAEAHRWLELPGITEAIAVAEVARIAARRSEKPKSFSYFTESMRGLSAALSAPKLSPAPFTTTQTPAATTETGQEFVLRLMRQVGLNPDTETMQ